jgi:hypothetical protein
MVNHDNKFVNQMYKSLKDKKDYKIKYIIVTNLVLMIWLGSTRYIVVASDLVPF